MTDVTAQQGSGTEVTNERDYSMTVYSGDVIGEECLAAQGSGIKVICDQ